MAESTSVRFRHIQIAQIFSSYRNVRTYVPAEKAAISIAANIVEGFKKKGKRDKARFYNISQGSLEECHYYLILSNDLEYADTALLIGNLMEISKMLESYRKTILSSKF